MFAGIKQKLGAAALLNLLFTDNFIRHWHQIFVNQQYIRIFRLAIGSTLSVAISYSIEWPLSFLTPILTVIFLSLPLPMLKPGQLLALMLMTMVAVFIGVALASYLLPYPFIFIIALGLLLFHAYYLMNRGGPIWFVINLLISILLMPMLANIHGGLATGVGLGFTLSSWVAIMMIYISQALLPDAVEAKRPKKKGLVKGYVPMAANKALKSTIVVLPLAILFTSLSSTNLIVVMISTAVHSLTPDITKGREAVGNSLISTLIGGAAAFFIYWMCVAVPQLYFFILVYFFVALLFAHRLFSDRPDAKFYSSALTTLLIVFHGSLGAGQDFISVFISRLSLIALAGVYVVTCLILLERYWPFKNANN